jgi:hypothetical protein
MSKKAESGRVRPVSKKMVPRTGIEPARLSTLDPKSSASTNFATSAFHAQPHRRVRIGRISRIPFCEKSRQTEQAVKRS